MPGGEGSGFLIFPRFVVVVAAEAGHVPIDEIHVVLEVRQLADGVPRGFGTLPRVGSAGAAVSLVSVH